MAVFSPQVLLMIFVSAAFQVAGVFLMPLTKGLTQPLPTLAATVCFLTGLAIMTRLIYSGVNLGLLTPIMSAIIPLCAIAIGIIFYREPANFAKIGMLTVACLLIGWASIT